MANLRWDGDDFRNEQSSSGTTADKISHSGKLQQGYRHGSLTQGLVAYYPMEKGSGQVLHDGELNNLGQINSATWASNGQAGNNNLSFDGTDDFINTPVTSKGLNQITITAWVYLNDAQLNNDFPVIFGSYPSSASNLFLRYDVGKNGLSWFTYDGSIHGFNGSPDISKDTWVHIAATFTGSEYKIYLNGGNTVKTVNDGTFATSSARNYIGAVNRDGSAQNHWAGKIDDVRVYDRALSQPEIKALYNLSQPSGTQVTEKQVPSQNQSGVSRYKLNGDVTDTWGSNDGTNNGVTFADGVYGQSGVFQKSNSDFVDTETNFVSSQPDQITISAWMKPNSNISGNYATVFGSEDSNHNELAFRKESDDTFSFFTLGSTNYGVQGGATVEFGEWQHFVGTYNSNEGYKLYKNGTLAAESPETGFNTNPDTEKIGSRESSSSSNNLYWDGQIDEVRIYNTALTPQQIEKLYHKGAYRIPHESTLQ